MKATATKLEGLKELAPRAFADARGFFLETYHRPRYVELGVDCTFVQTNHSRSVLGTLRGLHYQRTPGQAKLISVMRGRIFDVAVDIRPESPTFGQWHGAYLDDQNHAQMFVPIGFAHGFCVVSEVADVVYQVSSVYDGATECSIRFNDPEIGVEWPLADPLVSERDATAESFAAFKARHRQRDTT